MEQEPFLFKIAHISDLHFSKASFGLGQFFSKRWIGNLNLIFNRSKTYLNKQPYTLIDSFKKNKVTHVCISGDVSTTASKAEFLLALDFVKALKKEGFEVFVIPGNHDSYTKRSYRKKLFYEYFQQESLKTSKVAALPLAKGFWLVLIDSTYPTAVHYSTGLYTKQIDESLQALLASLPKEEVIFMMNHFPLFHHESPRRILQGAELLRKTLTFYPNVKLYLHGHTHRHCIADLRGNHLPIILDSGSASHVRRGSWNAVSVFSSGCQIEVLTAYEGRFWNLHQQFHYTW